MQSRTRMRWVAGLVLLAPLAWFGARAIHTESQAADARQVVAVTRGDLVATINPTGELAPERRVQLGFDVSRATLIELHVAPGQRVHEGDVLARIDPAPLQRDLEQAQADALAAEEALETLLTPATEAERRKAALAVAQAEAELQTDQLNLDALVEPDLGAATAAVAQAEYGLRSAQLNLTLTAHSSTVGKAVRDLEYALAWNERVLRDLQGKRDRGLVKQDEVDKAAQVVEGLRFDLQMARSAAVAALAEAEDRVIQAEQALAKAQEDLRALRAGPDSLALAQARNRLTQAELALLGAQDALTALQDGPAPRDLQNARTRHESALATLAEAQAALHNATLRAPFDATVVSTGARVGDLVSSSVTVVTLADLSRLRVLVSVDETEIGRVQVGQEALITFDALPAQRFSGQVLEVPLEGRLVQNVVTYEVAVSLEGAADAPLLPGMTANVALITGHRQDVLLLPVLAVQQAEEGAVVTLQDPLGGPPVTTRVELGLSDRQYVHVVRGLLEGDHVLVPLQSTTSQSPIDAARGGAGALFPGGAVIRR